MLLQYPAQLSAEMTSLWKLRVQKGAWIQGLITAASQPIAAERREATLHPLPPRVLLNSVSSTVVYVRHHQTHCRADRTLPACDGVYVLSVMWS